ncbi:MAG: hypothetical protein ABJC04_09165, partial [Verrucomicrobiota bacterium]
ILRMTNENTVYQVTLARDVTLFVLEFWDTQLGDWTEELTTSNQIPTMVRVSLGIGRNPNSAAQPAEIVSRVISMPSIAVGPDIQQPLRQAGSGSRGGTGNIPPGNGNPNGGTRNGGTRNGAGNNNFPNQGGGNFRGGGGNGFNPGNNGGGGNRNGLPPPGRPR